MKLGALALDFDGTTAVHGRLDPEVRGAIGEARRRGVVVALVTGRRLADLRGIIADELACFDVVVAENGAVLDFPQSGRHVLLGHPPNRAFLQALQNQRIDFRAGECVVEVEPAAAGGVLRLIRSLELPLILAFNRGHLMVLPQGVAKSTGLRPALLALRTSLHNTIGIGDAENDHDLLDVCEVGVAVEWGSAALRAVADETIRGDGPAAVAAYLRRVLAQPRLSAAQMGRRRLLLGHQHDGAALSLAVRGRTIVIAGEPGTGKSWLAGSLCEQLILQGYCLLVIDPEGDYRSLESLPGVLTLAGDEPLPHAREITQALRHPDVSVLVDLSKITHAAKIEYLTTLLPLLVALRRRTGLPHKILLDEAHYFLRGAEASTLVDTELAGYVFVTYRVSAIDPLIRSARDTVVMVTRETDPPEIQALLDMCSPPPDADAARRTFRDLRVNEAVLLPGAEESDGRLRRFRMAPRLTSHVRHRAKYLDMPVAEAHAFVFTDSGQDGPRARSLKELVGLLAVLPADRLVGHLRRHDYSRWIDEVLRDRELAAHLRTIEDRLGAADLPDIVAAIDQAIRARYETTAQ